jgi:hypothetical protein
MVWARNVKAGHADLEESEDMADRNVILRTPTDIFPNIDIPIVAPNPEHIESTSVARPRFRTTGELRQAGVFQLGLF